MRRGRSVLPGRPAPLEPLGALALPSMLCGLSTAQFSYRILELYRQRGPFLVLGTAIIPAFTALFISSWAMEVDSMLAALMTAFLHEL